MPIVPRILDQQPVHSLDDYIEGGGGTAAATARAASPAEIIDVVRASGLRGRGGAGFPTGVKWETVAASQSGFDDTTVVVNAAEGEPGTFKDRALLRTNPYRVLEGAIVAALAMETDRIRIGIKASFGREIDRVTRALREMRDAGWIDGLDIGLVLGPSSYLFGEETGLLEVIEGRQPFPRVTPPYRRGLTDHDTRSGVGVALATEEPGGGPPALVDNVETLANVPLIVERGPEWFRGVGTDRSPGTIVCTVTGATRRSGVGELAMGSTLREAIDAIGWGKQSGHQITYVLSGTANAIIPAHLLDTPLTYEALRDAGSGLGSAGFIVFDETTSPLAIAAGVSRFLAVESCGQCEPCKLDGLFIAETLERSLRTTPTADEVDELRYRIGTVPAGARCNLAQQQATVAESLLALLPQPLDAPDSALSADADAQPVRIAPIADMVGGRALLDARQSAKQPDWSYDEIDSGALPAARLGNTPVHIERRRSRQWPDWSAWATAGHPLELVDDAHDAIHALIDRAIGAPDRDVRDLVLAVRTHIDVTQRVLYPMVSRVGAEEGDALADAAETQEHKITQLVAQLRSSPDRDTLERLSVEMCAHADIEDDILELLRTRLDPTERANLADGLATAQATSTVSRLHRTASKLAELRVDHPMPPAPAPEAAPETAAPTPPPAAEPVAAPAAETPRRARRTGRPSARILVGVDGSAAASAALGWAGRLAARIDAEVLVGNVFETDQAELSPEEYHELLAAAHERLGSEWSEPLRGMDVDSRPLLLVGDPDRLLSATESEGADLLVVGTRAPGRVAALHLGSLAHHLAHRTRAPLAIIPTAGADSDIDTIVVGVDGSEGSLHAVRWCAKVAAAAHAEVVAVCSFDSESPWGSKGEAAQWRQTAEEAIGQQWIHPLRAAGVSVRTRITEAGHPVAALAEAAEQEKAGVIVVGTRGLNETLGARVGRLPLQLVHHTHLPVVLVPPGHAAS